MNKLLKTLMALVILIGTISVQSHVRAAEPTIEEAERGTLSMEQTVIEPGQPITVHYTGAQNAKDWIGLYRSDETPESNTPSQKWAYVQETPDGIITISDASEGEAIALMDLAPGDYYFALLLNDGYEEHADRLEFQIVNKAVTQLKVIPETVKLQLNEEENNVQIQVEAAYTASETLNVTAADGIQYVSNDELVATVTSTGLVEGVSEGTAVVSITYEGKSAEVAIAVESTPDSNPEPEPEPGAATLTGSDSVKGGSTVELIYALQDVADNQFEQIYAQGLSLNFDPAYLEFKGVDSLRGDDLMVSAKENAPGKIHVLAASKGIALDSHGEWLKFKLAGKANTSGDTQVTLSNIVIANGTGSEYAVPDASHQITVKDEGMADITVESITINGASAITTKGGTAQMTAVVLPENATNKAVVWSVTNGTGKAIISPSGLLTAVSNGTVTVKATAQDGSGVEGTKAVTISGQTSTGPGPSDPGSSSPGSSGSGSQAPSTPTPPKSNLEIVGNKAIVALDQKNPSASVSVEELKDFALELRADGASLTISAATIKYLLSQAQNLVGAVLEASINPVADADKDAPVSGGTARIKAAGQAYQYNLLLRTADGKQIKLDAAKEGLDLVLDYEAGVDESLLGIYAYNETAHQWEYVGGVIDPASKQIKASLDRLGSIAAFEYSKLFEDVPASHWVSRTLQVLAAKHIVKGTGDTQFSPNGQTNRAEFTALLVRALGLTATNQAVPFQDVSSNKWYTSEIAAAYQAGLITGISQTHFAPEAEITREQMAALLVRAYEYKLGDILATGDELAAFSDRAQVSDWAKGELSKAIAAGIMQGKGNGLFHPGSEATRAETAQAIYNLLLGR